jgi:hypothetical protein
MIQAGVASPIQPDKRGDGPPVGTLRLQRALIHNKRTAAGLRWWIEAPSGRELWMELEGLARIKSSRCWRYTSLALPRRRTKGANPQLRLSSGRRRHRGAADRSRVSNETRNSYSWRQGLTSIVRTPGTMRTVHVHFVSRSREPDSNWPLRGEPLSIFILTGRPSAMKNFLGGPAMSRGSTARVVRVVCTRCACRSGVRE